MKREIERNRGDMSRRNMICSTGAVIGASMISPLQTDAASKVDKSEQRLVNPTMEPVCLSDFEAIARNRISHMAYEYVAGGAADHAVESRSL
jgi:hypothetical protein